MKLNRLSLENWRGIKKASIEFGPAITIVGGPNESGKSSMRDALRAALLLTGERKEKKILEACRPWDTKLNPKVKLDFVCADTICSVQKEFLRKKGEWATLECNGKLKATDEIVQEELTKLLGDSAGWIDVLWGTQGIVSFDSAPDTMKGRLAAAAQATVMPQVTQLYETIVDEFDKYWTEKTRKPNKDFQRVREASEEARKDVSLLEWALKEADQKSEEISVKSRELQELEKQLSQLEKSWKEGNESLSIWETYGKAKADAGLAENTCKSISQWLESFKSISSQIKRLFPESKSWQQSMEAIRKQLAQPPSRAEIDALTARKKFLELYISQEKYRALEAIEIPEQKELKELLEIERTLQDIAARLKMGELRAELVAEKDLQIEISKDNGAAGSLELKAASSEKWTAEQGFELNLPGVARLKVESGNPAVTQDISRRQELESKLKNALAKWQANNIPELVEKTNETRLKLSQSKKVDEAEISAARKKVADADTLETLPADEMEALLATLPASIQAAELMWNAAQKAHQEVVAKQQELAKNNPAAVLSASVKNLEAHWLNYPLEEKPALKIPRELSGEPGSGEPGLELGEERKREASGRAGSVESAGSVEQAGSAEAARSVEIDAFFKTLVDHESKCSELLKAKQAEHEQSRAKVVRPDGQEVSKDSLDKIESDKNRVVEQKNALAASVNQMRGNIEAQGDLYGRLVKAKEALARCEADEKRVELDAYAIKELREAFETVREQLQKDVVKPLEDVVSKHFESLTQNRYNSVKFDQSLKLETLETDSVSAVAIEDVSFGTREQLALLTRLCLAELLAKEDSGQVVILDDNLVHTDDERMETACRLLEDASEKVQIIVFTCHPERYDCIKNACRVKVG